jgi:hypothetical protein
VMCSSTGPLVLCSCQSFPSSFFLSCPTTLHLQSLLLCRSTYGSHWSLMPLLPPSPISPLTEYWSRLLSRPLSDPGYPHMAHCTFYLLASGLHYSSAIKMAAVCPSVSRLHGFTFQKTILFIL